MEKQIRKDLVALVKTSPLFRVIRNHSQDVLKHVTVKSFGDCEHVVTPAEKDNIGIVIQGVVNVISDEKIYK